MVKHGKPSCVTQAGHDVHQLPMHFPNTPPIARVMSYQIYQKYLQWLSVGASGSDCLDLNPCSMSYYTSDPWKLLNISVLSIYLLK